MSILIDFLIGIISGLITGVVTGTFTGLVSGLVVSYIWSECIYGKRPKVVVADTIIRDDNKKLFAIKVVNKSKYDVVNVQCFLQYCEKIDDGYKTIGLESLEDISPIVYKYDKKQRADNCLYAVQYYFKYPADYELGFCKNDKVIFSFLCMNNKFAAQSVNCKEFPFSNDNAVQSNVKYNLGDDITVCKKDNSQHFIFEVCIPRVFDRYKSDYKCILEDFYPAKNSTGFSERNLSVNYCRAYETIAKSFDQKAFSWYEFQFGKNNKKHLDAIIVNEDSRELYIIESKRFSKPYDKIDEINYDIFRMYDLVDELKDENRKNSFRVNLGNVDKIYGVILADVWRETPIKNEIYESFKFGVNNPDEDGTYVNKYCNDTIKDLLKTDLQYYCISFEDIEKVKNYSLVSFVWKIE